VLRRFERVGDATVEVASVHEVEPQLSQTPGRRSGRLALERLTDCLVESAAATCGDIAIQGFAHLVVDEPVAAVRLRPDQARADSHEDQLLGLLDVDAGDCPEYGHRAASADH
jgi:hypothetical protein